MNVNSTNPLMTNPLDELFQTAQPVGEITEYDTVTEGELAELQGNKQGPEIDADDVENDARIVAIHDAALETFQNQMAYTEIVEPRYAARNAEVAANYLNIALNAASVKARVKADRKKTAAFVPYTGNRADGIVVASREDIMRAIAVDAETKKI